jgi:hypothetical protein
MRLCARVAALVLVLAPLAARADAPQAPEIARGPGSPAECARLDKQIHHFEDMVDRAEALDNQMWTERTQQHVDLLKERQKVRCPRDAEDASAKAALLAFLNMLKLAGKAALSYFTFGAF